MGCGSFGSRSPVSMFNFSANHLVLLSRTEGRRCVVFVVRDDSTLRIYRLYDFAKSRIITPAQYYRVSGKVNSAGKLYLVIESVKPDTKHPRASTALFPLTAREVCPWANASRQGTNSTRHSGGERRGVPAHRPHTNWCRPYPAETGSLLSRC